ncbi:hypothetical protein X777_07515, partial [Ooceraea biroi]
MVQDTVFASVSGVVNSAKKNPTEFRQIGFKDKSWHFKMAKT